MFGLRARKVSPLSKSDHTDPKVVLGEGGYGDWRNQQTTVKQGQREITDITSRRSASSLLRPPSTPPIC
ncbi:hypothetical protein Bpfe_014792 [Biomphalaria pfeifferi]|uniref:Uncharacterized protein n=1 Tax=Biomphalaria pfeifferi TaxID=112525 RepID=A0AAD8BK11_BIOPF|nr:hypothetical protein Bpfe_014792 [Biomphalaria pfeifferi]